MSNHESPFQKYLIRSIGATRPEEDTASRHAFDIKGDQLRAERGKRWYRRALIIGATALAGVLAFDAATDNTPGKFDPINDPSALVTYPIHFVTEGIAEHLVDDSSGPVDTIVFDNVPSQDLMIEEGGDSLPEDKIPEEFIPR